LRANDRGRPVIHAAVHGAFLRPTFAIFLRMIAAPCPLAWQGDGKEAANKGVLHAASAEAAFTLGGRRMKHSLTLLALAGVVAALSNAATAGTSDYSGGVASDDFVRFIEEHSGDAVRLAAEGDLPADQIEKTDDAVFFWQQNVQIGVAPNALRNDKIAINGCYRIRLADARVGVTAYFLDNSSDCE
jgi:hypothetical protein